ncbi:MAG: PspA/IM30 family protein [Candidatus Coatesbacteria bacterium]|nr:MAG: PspA/IM30 family protein [Candidatus Coatesbacteria bacterium]
MGVLERIAKVIEANLNSLLSSAEDPEKMLRQIMIDMREHYREAQRQVTIALADEKRLEAKYRQAKADTEEWQRRAVLALQKGREDLAREALLRKQETAAAASEYLTQLEQQSVLVERLKHGLVALDRKIDEASRKKELLLARQKRTEAAQTINRAVASLDDRSAFEAFARVEDKVAELEATTEAEAEVAALAATKDLEEEFKKLETGDVDVELKALKASMGLALAAGEPLSALPEPEEAEEVEEGDWEGETAGA